MPEPFYAGLTENVKSSIVCGGRPRRLTTIAVSTQLIGGHSHRHKVYRRESGRLVGYIDRPDHSLESSHLSFTASFISVCRSVGLQLRFDDFQLHLRFVDSLSCLCPKLLPHSVQRINYIVREMPDVIEIHT